MKRHRENETKSNANRRKQVGGFGEEDEELEKVGPCKIEWLVKEWENFNLTWGLR